MNTEQNYVGGGNYANTIEPTANTNPQTVNNQAKAPSTVDNRQPTPLQENLYESLHQLINDFLNEASASGPVELVNELLLTYLHDAVSLDDSAGPSKQYAISQANLDRIQNVIKLTQFLVRLGETWQHIRQIQATVE